MLLFPPYWARETIPAFNLDETTQKIETPKPVVTKKILPASNYYQGIYISRETLIGQLEYEFHKLDLDDQIPAAIFTLNGESSFNWNTSNGISAGLAAFTPPTWNEQCRQFGRYEELNPLKHIQCMALLWNRGEQGRWDVWCTSKYNINNDWRCSSRGLYP